MDEGDTPPLWYAVFKGDLDGTQYAKGRFAVRRNSVISYADINLYFKKIQFSSKTQHTWHTMSKNSKTIARSLRSRFFGDISAFLNLNMDFGRSKYRKFNKQTHQTYCFQELLYMCIQHTVILTSLCKWKRPKWLLLFFVVKRYAVREAKQMAVRSTQSQNRAVRSTQGGRGVSPSWM